MISSFSNLATIVLLTPTKLSFHCVLSEAQLACFMSATELLKLDGNLIVVCHLHSVSQWIHFSPTAHDKFIFMDLSLSLMEKWPFCGGSAYKTNQVFQTEHALYTPGLDENRGSSDFVHDIWIYYKVQCAKFCTLHFITYPDVGYKVATAAILIQTRGVQSVFSLEKVSISNQQVAYRIFSFWGKPGKPSILKT